MLAKHRRRRLLQHTLTKLPSFTTARQEQPKRWRRTIRKLNEQRRNLVQLADYTFDIVAPSFFFLTLGALMTSIIPHYYAKCIQVVAPLDPNPLHLSQALVGLAVSSTLGALFTGGRGALFWIAGSRANFNIRIKLHRNLLLQEAAFFDATETGSLLSRLNNDVNKIGMVISYHVNVVCRQLAQFVFGSVYLIRISPMLSLWTFGGILMVAYVSAVYGAFNRKLAERVQDTFADATAVAETSFSMSETIRAFDGVKIDSLKFQDAQNRALALEETQAWGYGFHKFVSDTLQSILQVLLLFACWRMGTVNGLPAAQLTTFMFYTNFVLESSNEVGDQWAKIQGAIGASSSVFDLIRRVPEVRDPPLILESSEKENGVISLSTTTKNNINGHDRQTPIIEMKDVRLLYGAMDVPALNGVHLNFYPGDRVAIVGRSGSGKSSMLRVILRFYDPTSGTIALDGKLLSDMSRRELASKISVVEQEPQLFPASLIDNVLYGLDKDAIDPATNEPCYSADWRQKTLLCLRIAGLDIQPGNDLNLELDTRVGDGGRSLSGGQRQRVAIARALIRNPYVLLLDEPTAALDSESEKKVILALKSAMEHAESMVMVTHRLGVIRQLEVNRVIVMEKGEVVEEGHPEELLKQDGLYARLAREQGITSEKELRI
jgi:ABC-type multidrug transport system fused ATPase/permease subunit